MTEPVLTNILTIALISFIFLTFVLTFLLRKYYNLSQHPEASKFDNLIDERLKVKLDQAKAELSEEYKQKIEELEREQAQKLTQKSQALEHELQSKNEIELQKERLSLKLKMQDEESQMRQRLITLQENIKNKEDHLEAKLENIENERQKLNKLQEDLRNHQTVLNEKQAELDKEKQHVLSQLDIELEKISGLSKDEAKERILSQAQEEMGEELTAWQSKYLDNFEEKVMDKAREITVLAIQRCSSEVANEFTITTVKLQNDEDKGKLIGKGGRNIQWLEKTLGVELIIDDTPGVITISGFSSIRRHIAKKTVEKLLDDGRVHPSAIEEMYEKAKSEIAQEIYEAGQWAVNELGIYDFPTKLIRLLGRLKFRTGYGQNVLKHSVEMAKLAGLLADGLNAEFGFKKPIDRMIALKGALLHDIGKAVDEDMIPKGNHIEIGEKICDMFELDWRIKKCISSHHTTGGDRQSYWDKARGAICLEAAVVDACDTLSGGRPGARKETVEAYIQRLEALENIANKVNGVTKSWVMRGASELWVFFDADNMSPTQMHRTTRKLARDINNSIKTPKEIKVIGIREDRVVEYTR